MNEAEFLKAEKARLIRVWNILAPPLRPSIYDVGLYARGLENRRCESILIQGVTPELVDLALSRGASRVIAVNKEKAYFTAMRHFARQDWSRLEAVVGDWRTFIPELGLNLDAVLGDGTLTLLTFPVEWKKVLQHTHQYLAPGGLLILRLSFQPEEPFDLDRYMRGMISRLDARSSETDPEKRFEFLREVVADIRIAFGVGTAETKGAVDRNRRADWVRLFHEEFAARLGHWEEWDRARVGMPKEEAIRSGKDGGQICPGL